MKKKSNIFVSLLLAAALMLSIFAGLGVSASAEDGAQQSSPLNEHGLVENVEGGAILHCWCWSFNSIKENMEKIAGAGYSAVQTSPINGIFDGDDGMEIWGDGKWYYSYQPTNYNIGNYMLGTENEFKAMCDTAESYGVKVIVDVVANHTTPSKNYVDSSLKNISGGLYHGDLGSSTDTREWVTQWYDGLPDVNTQNKNYQNVILNFLKKAVQDGADGFRYDTAKHIELPDDNAKYASDFWPTVLDNGSVYQYGEVLQGTNSSEVKAARLPDYAQIMHVTASSYGNTIRDYFLNNTGTARTLKNYNAEGAASDRLVTWVESHDTYANGETPNNVVSSYWLTNDQIRIGWAMIAARSDTTCLFFSRPYGSKASTVQNRNNSPIWGTNKLGAAGDDNYFHPEVTAVNKFRNAMIGESETLENISGPEGSKRYLMITRGTRGAVIINNSSTDLELNKATTIVKGTYTDLAHGSEFISNNGMLTGVVKAGEIAVIYDAEDKYTEHVHQWGEWTVSKPATFEEDGELTRECTDLPAHSETQSFSALGSVSYSKDKFSYNGKTQKPSVKAFDKDGVELVKDVDYKVKYPAKSVNAGKYKVELEFIGKYSGTDVKQYSIAQIKNTISVKASTKTVKAASVKKKAVSVTPLKVTKAQGAVTYKKASGSAKLTVNSKTGKITVKKGTKKGTYTAKIMATAKGNTNYKSGYATVKVTVKVK